LARDDTVAGDADGRCCDLDAAGYAALQAREAMFYSLTMKGDGASLQKELKTKIPSKSVGTRNLPNPAHLICCATGKASCWGVASSGSNLTEVCSRSTSFRAHRHCSGQKACHKKQTAPLRQCCARGALAESSFSLK
jgi:hypothetical protein